MKKILGKIVNQYRIYSTVLKISLQERFEHRADIILRLFISVFTLILAYFLWTNVYGDRSLINGYTKPEMITYYLFSAYLWTMFGAGLNFSEEIRDGSVLIHLSRPFNYVLFQLFKNLSAKLIRIIFGTVIMICIFLIFSDNLVVIKDPLNYLLLIVTSLGAMLIIYLYDMIIQLLEFWVLESTGLYFFTDTIFNFFSGVMIPLVLLPESLQTISNFLPFKYSIYFIINTVLGKLTGTEIIEGLLIQYSWILGLSLLVGFMWRRGLKKFEAAA